MAALLCNWQLATGSWLLHHRLSSYLVTIESREKRRIPFGKLTVDLQTGVGPAADPLAVVQVRAPRRAVPHVCLVIAAARAQWTRPAPAAIGLLGDVMLFEEGGLRAAIDAVAHRPKLVRVRPGEPVAERDVAVGRHAEQAQSGAAGIRLADALVDFLQRILHVRKSVVPIRRDVLEELLRERAKLIEHAIEAALADCVLLIGRG